MGVACWEHSRCDRWRARLDATGGRLVIHGWRAAIPLYHDTLGDVIAMATDGHPLPYAISATTAVSIPNVEIQADTDSELALVAARSVAYLQKGFIADRLIDEDIVGFDGGTATASLRPGGQLVGLLFDFEAAFPSLGHGWSFMLLERMALPPRLRRVIRVMYHDLRTVFVVGGHSCVEVRLRGGVRQACPLSGSLFAIALDPVIRYFLEQATFASCRIFAFADDLAVVLTCFVLQLEALGAMFANWFAASGLCLKARKCVMLLVWQGLHVQARELVDCIAVFVRDGYRDVSQVLRADGWPWVHPGPVGSGDPQALVSLS